jgi:hypothetical protein
MGSGDVPRPDRRCHAPRSPRRAGLAVPLGARPGPPRSGSRSARWSPPVSVFDVASSSPRSAAMPSTGSPHGSRVSTSSRCSRCPGSRRTTPRFSKPPATNARIRWRRLQNETGMPQQIPTGSPGQAHRPDARGHRVSLLRGARTQERLLRPGRRGQRRRMSPRRVVRLPRPQPLYRVREAAGLTAARSRRRGPSPLSAASPRGAPPRCERCASATGRSPRRARRQSERSTRSGGPVYGRRGVRFERPSTSSGERSCGGPATADPRRVRHLDGSGCR